MPYTFGAGIGDDITWTMGVTASAASRAALVTGWWYPTTLTATRGLWSFGNTVGAEIDATTSELRLRTDNTTDGQWTTTGAALATTKWSFLAFLLTNLNSGTLASWRVWMGTVDTAPAEITVTNATPPSGNNTGASTFYIGNKGTGSLAFQGDIADVGVFVTGAAAGVRHPFHIATLGTITQAEADFVKERYVWPMWLGLGWASAGPVRRHGETAITSNGDEAGYICLNTTLPQARRYGELATVFPGVTPTINGATPSLNGAPRPLAVHSPYLPARRR